MNLGYYYINLDKDESRRKNTEKQFSDLNINNYHRISGIKYRNPKTGCCLSHIDAIYTAYKSSYEYAVIMEDDLIFTEGLNCISNIIPHLSKDWEILQCHTINPYLLKSLVSRCELGKPIYNKLLKGYFMSTACYLINRKGMEIFVSKMVEERSIGYILNVDLSNPRAEAEELVFRYLNSYTFLIPLFNTVELEHSNISNDLSYRQNNINNMILYNKLVSYGVDSKHFQDISSYSKLPYNLHWINEHPANRFFIDRLYKERLEFLVFLHSGLGDRLFQYCSLYAISKVHNAKFNVFMNTENKYNRFFNIENDFPVYKEKSLLNAILDNTNDIHTYNALIMDNVEYYHNKKGENCKDFVKNFNIKPENKTYIFSGLYRDENFFIDFKPELKAFFRENPKDMELLNLLNDFYNDMICIHINLKNIDVNLDEYYKNAIIRASAIVNNVKFIIVSNDIRDDIYKKYPYMSGIPLLFLKDKSEITELFFMTRCKGVICSNNTFSWWGAWLSKNNNPLIYIPNKWFKNNDSFINMRNSIILDI